MKKNLLALAVLCAMTSGAAFAQQAEGPWQVRVRAVNLDSANKGSLGKGSTTDLSINDKVIPEVDISYFFTPNIAAELILTYPQKQDVRSGSTKLGTLKHLPPTLTAQYHFTGLSGFKPYVGAGINYTRFSSINVASGGAPLTVDKNSFGGALQVGVDIPLSKNLSLNVDVKKVYIKTDVKVIATGTTLGDFKVDPVLFGIGLGYRF